MAAHSPNYVAAGDVNPSRFVNVTATNTVSQADAVTDKLVGVSQEWAKDAPIPNASSIAATTGDPIKVYGLGEVCLLQSTSAGWTAGDRLSSDALGRGVTAAATDEYGASALSTVTGSALGRVQVIQGKNP